MTNDTRQMTSYKEKHYTKTIMHKVNPKWILIKVTTGLRVSHDHAHQTIVICYAANHVLDRNRQGSQGC